MGFRKQRTLYKLVFEDPELEGLEVMAKALPLEAFLSIQRLASTADTDPEAAEAVVKKLAKILVSWNLEDEDGNAQPCTYEGLAAQEYPFVLTIFNAWVGAITTVPKASANGSSAGGISLEPSIRMEVGSPNPTS